MVVLEKMERKGPMAIEKTSSSHVTILRHYHKVFSMKAITRNYFGQIGPNGIPKGASGIPSISMSRKPWQMKCKA